MICRKYILILCMLSASLLRSQDTFSILAFDSVSREIGAAGASCVDLFNYPAFTNDFIAEIFPDTGAVVTQASYLAANQANARKRMRAGDSAHQVISWLLANDAGGPFSNSSQRQYGVIKPDGAQVAAFTGSNCLAYKNHITGPGYTIQGNILLGGEVLDSMEARFLRAEGDLACRLMAAMEGANMIGADSRCAGNNTSSLFAFLKVALPTDTFGKPSFLISLKTANGSGIEPIDSLRKMFDASRTCTVNTTGLPSQSRIRTAAIYPVPADRSFFVESPSAGISRCDVSDLEGRILLQEAFRNRLQVNVREWAKGLYFVKITTDEGYFMKKLIVN